MSRLPMPGGTLVAALAVLLATPLGARAEEPGAVLLVIESSGTGVDLDAIRRALGTALGRSVLALSAPEAEHAVVILAVSLEPEGRRARMQARTVWQSTLYRDAAAAQGTHGGDATWLVSELAALVREVTTSDRMGGAARLHACLDSLDSASRQGRRAPGLVPWEGGRIVAATAKAANHLVPWTWGNRYASPPLTAGAIGATDAERGSALSPPPAGHPLDR